jgi:hypothetical protein
MTQQSAIRVNSIVSLNGTGPVELPYGATIPSDGTLNASGNVNITGVTTIATIDATNIQATTVSATSFVGDGSQLTGLPIVNDSKVIALTLIS